MDLNTKQTIDSLAGDIIKQFNVKIPVDDIKELVYRLGGTIRYTHVRSGSKVMRDGEKFIIILPEFQDKAKERIMISNELGHLFLHMGYLINDELWEQQPDKTYYQNKHADKEWQANAFGASLLMPKEEYQDTMAYFTRDNQTDLLKVANHFNVSVNAVFDRKRFLESLA